MNQVLYLLSYNFSKPFKDDLDKKDSLVCILCGKLRGKVGDDKCMCSSITYCKTCEDDNQKLKMKNSNHTRSCQMHGSYRNYEESLIIKKNYIMVIVTIIMLLIALFLFNINLSLNWLYLFMGILVGPGSTSFHFFCFLFFNFQVFICSSCDSNHPKFVLGSNK